MTKTISFKVLTHKDYMAIFNICEKTAKRWIAEDRRRIESKRITDYHLQKLYGISWDPPTGNNRA